MSSNVLIEIGDYHFFSLLIVALPNFREHVFGDGAYVPPYPIALILLAWSFVDLEVIFYKVTPGMKFVKGGSGATSGTATSTSVVGLEFEGTVCWGTNFEVFSIEFWEIWISKGEPGYLKIKMEIWKSNLKVEGYNMII